MIMTFGDITFETREGWSDSGCLREMWGGHDSYEIAGLDDVRTVVDIGANIGTFAILVAHLYPHAFVRAFEPEPENYALLVRNIEANGMGDRIETIAAAVSDHRNGIDLHPGHGLTHMCTALPGQRCEANPGHDAHTVRSDSVTLDDALAGLERVDLLKVDCEGSEFDIFRSPTAETLAKVMRLRMEIHDYRGPAETAALKAKLAESFSLREIKFVPGSGGLWFGER